MGDDIEAEVRRLVQRIAERATQGGGLERETYDALTAASAALSALARAFEREGHEETLRAMLARLRACEAEPFIKAA
ncbi:hypothetical protein [Methylobacterium longum]|uniref:Uncharacterized protein n=1 Tax=Methylobacterium longum TaxID=767694 RepID=A0ABT8APY1_9HYPH|nr:hypothetical protein [Methylobacterium longum]MDN3571893.1 hypothetical protein [Methylobacterium longum]